MKVNYCGVTIEMPNDIQDGQRILSEVHQRLNQILSMEAMRTFGAEAKNLHGLMWKFVHQEGRVPTAIQVDLTLT